MGCITSGMVQTSPENSKNKVEPVPLKTDKVSRGVARDQRQQDIAKHRNDAYSKAKSLSDRVLAEKETLSTSSTVRSSWSRNTPIIRTDLQAEDGGSSNGTTNPTDKVKGQCTAKSVHFNTENRVNSGRTSSDIPGLLVDASADEQGITMVTKRAPTPSPMKQQMDVVGDKTHQSDEQGKADGANVNTEDTQADEADGTDDTKQSSDDQNNLGDSNNISTETMATDKDNVSDNNMAVKDDTLQDCVHNMNGDEHIVGGDMDMRTTNEIKSDGLAKNEEPIGDEGS